MQNRVRLIETNNTQGMLQVPEHLIGQVSKILKDQFGILIEEREITKKNQRQYILKKQLNLLLSQIMQNFKNYCKINQFDIIQQEIDNIQQKKQFSKKFSLYNLHQLLYENQFCLEFRDKFENYLSSGLAEKDLNECKKITEDLKKELKIIISQLLLEVLKNNPKTSIFKHQLNRK